MYALGCCDFAGLFGIGFLQNARKGHTPGKQPLRTQRLQDAFFSKSFGKPQISAQQ